MCSQPEVGVLGVRLFGEHNIVQESCARFPKLGSMLGMEHWWSEFQGLTMQDLAHDENHFVDHVIGAYYLADVSAYHYARLNRLENK